jgi:hypothetical protein
MMSERFYSEKQIYVAAFLGGPIPPGLLIYRNFKNLGEGRKAITTLMLTFVFTILLFFALFQLPEQITDKIPSLVFSSLYALIVYLVYHHYFAITINPRIEDASNKFSNWRVTGITVAGLLINLVLIFGMAVMAPAFPGDKVTYGNIGNEIFFDEGDIDIESLDELAKVLYNYQYFSADYKQSVRIEKTANQYRLLMPMGKDFWENQELIYELKRLKTDLKIILGAETSLILEDYTLSNTITKEI